MPRASDYLLEGYTYHLTQRCHNREFLLGLAKDRAVYREWLRQGVKRHGVSVYGFCITSNHVHVLLHVDSVDGVSRLPAVALLRPPKLLSEGGSLAVAWVCRRAMFFSHCR